MKSRVFKRFLRTLVAAAIGAAVPAILVFVQGDEFATAVGPFVAPVVAALVMAVDKFVREHWGSWGQMFLLFPPLADE